MSLEGYGGPLRDAVFLGGNAVSDGSAPPPPPHLGTHIVARTTLQTPQGGGSRPVACWKPACMPGIPGGVEIVLVKMAGIPKGTLFTKKHAKPSTLLMPSISIFFVEIIKM